MNEFRHGKSRPFTALQGDDQQYNVWTSAGTAAASTTTVSVIAAVASTSYV